MPGQHEDVEKENERLRKEVRFLREEREVARLGLRSRRYVTQSGRDQGGNVMSRGHIHKILTNALYAGRIAHKGASFEGQHPAIIEAEHWERVQAILTEQSATPRGKPNSGRPTSPLAGKIYDISGEPLTPVHTQKAGRCYEYYISQCLKTAAVVPGQRQGRGWCLPARALEARINSAVSKHLRTAILRGLVADADPQRISDIIARIDQSDFDMLDLIELVRIEAEKFGLVAVWCRSFDSVMCSKGDEPWAQPGRMNFARTRCVSH